LHLERERKQLAEEGKRKNASTKKIGQGKESWSEEETRLRLLPKKTKTANKVQ